MSVFVLRDARVQQIRKEAELADTDFDEKRRWNTWRPLGGGIAWIKVGAATETELKDKKLRYEDALNSVESAKELGIVPGGGACLAYLQQTLEGRVMDAIDDEDERQGASILMRSLSAPCMQDAGVEGAVVLAKIQSMQEEKGLVYGWDAKTMTYCYLMVAGIIDPAKVTINAIENSASVAGLVLTTECLVTEIPVEVSDEQQQAMFDAQNMGAGMGPGIQ